VVQDAWYRYLEKLKLEGRRMSEPDPPPFGVGEIAQIEIPFDHTDVRAIIDSMFLDGSLHPLAVSDVPTAVPGWIKAGIVEDVWSQFALAEKGIEALATAVPEADAPHKLLGRLRQTLWRDAEPGSRIARQGCRRTDGRDPGAHQGDPGADGRTVAGVDCRRPLRRPDPATAIKGPVMVHHVPRFLRQRRSAGEAKVALLVFDGLAFDQWVRIREHLIANQQPLAFDESTAFAWLPTVTSVSRQALFSGLRPREFDDSIDHTNKEEALWKAFWQNEGGVAPAR
jgi:hypothetical protein